MERINYSVKFLYITFLVCVLQLLTVAVLAIVVTAPIGAVAISITGPLLLSRAAASVAAADDVEMQRR